MIVVSGPAEGAIFFNKGWLDFTGRTLEQELCRGWTSGIHPDDLQSTLTQLDSIYASRAEFETEYRHRRADGEYRHLLCKGIPRFEPDGEFTGFIVSLVDISDMKRSQEEALARQKLESLGVLAAGIAHDFNNLLGSIMAESELADAELPEGSCARASVQRISAVATRASGLVRQLMAYAGQDSADFEPLDLAALAREMIELMKVSISKAAVLKIELPDELPLVQGNPAQLRQVIMNLITNASQALGDKEGVISVNLALADGDRLRLRVSDTGCGMTEEVQRRIFDPFFTTKGAGRGMGLAALQGIVRAHHGDISVVSYPGRGSCFELLLPIDAAQIGLENKPPMTAFVDSAKHRTGTVLLIDDEDALRTASAKILRLKGYTVFDAADGDSGIDLFQQHAAAIDVVLLDVTLPGMSGLRLLEEFQRIRPDVRVVLISAHARDHAIAVMGGDSSLLYLRKPYRVAELTDLLLAICPRTTMART